MVLRQVMIGGGGGRNKGGQYSGVTLSHEGKRRSHLVHRLVAAAFLGPCRKGQHVDHRNDKKTDNRAENLEYVTPKENYRRATASGLNYKAHGEQHGNASITEADVREIRRLKKTGVTQRSIAKQLGLTEFHVSKICRGVLWSHVK